ncbi:polysaccharide deacetylase family protein [Yinghuangia sp. ASG 101]|uniref:polysaccharide deacetylase family protein n=1 Tax=Yinghuangia sp. ASG 101 TaxID=2896848 RepID=UPI001E3C264D|nr:polysaccharide deacetylase family protein [Yinghuangia sp. ASG 101]UGQ10647.1 polysaccharide deacetylase family protein [Yinghuangia sp. ASG 101]
MTSSRRALLRNLSLAGAGAAIGAAAAATAEHTLLADDGGQPRHGPATHPDRHTPPRHGHVDVNWNVDTEKKLIALTFDDGPMPDWTPMVLDTLEKADVPATFFTVGERIRDNARILRGRTGRHEYANHTWAHKNMATMDQAEAYDAIAKAHDMIEQVTGREPRHLRPPYGHLGGTTLLAAADLGYDITLWSLQMVESEYVANPSGLVTYIVDAVLPGTILLAHDTGAQDRLVALRGLPEMISGLRAKGFEFTTVSGLLEEAAVPAEPPAPAPAEAPAAPA